MHTDVLIVGAGPTGLMLANQLARRGIRIMIIDRHAGPAQQTRAMAVQARTLEIYAKLGVIEPALALGTCATGANMWANGRWRARIPIGDIGKGMSPFPFGLMLGQDDNERILGERVREFGTNVQWNTELVALEQQPDRVCVTLKQPDGSSRQLDALWVACCDGSRSAVRELNGVGFPGAPYEHVFFVADTEATGPMRPDEVNLYLWQSGFHLFFPMRGKDRWRVIGILPKALRDKSDLEFADLEAAIQKEEGSDLVFKRCDWFSTYRIHHRAAERFRSGRCFLLGDAAHIHSPMGGLGMNTGLQDAYNLAWKLALVVQSRADVALLDSYAAERMPVAKRLLESTDRAFQLVVSESWFAALLRTQVIARVAARAMTFDRVRQLAFRTLSQIGISYPKSALSRSIDTMPAGSPVSGDRFPWLRLSFAAGGNIEDLFQKLDDTRFTLLIFGQHSPALGEHREFGGNIRVFVVPDGPPNDTELSRVCIPRPSFFLLRPDGHVGLCGHQLDVTAIASYASEALHLTTPSDIRQAAVSLSHESINRRTA